MVDTLSLRPDIWGPIIKLMGGLDSQFDVRHVGVDSQFEDRHVGLDSQFEDRHVWPLVMLMGGLDSHFQDIHVWSNHHVAWWSRLTVCGQTCRFRFTV